MTDKECYKEALKFSSVKEFGEKSKKAYKYAYRKGLMKKFHWLKNSRLEFHNVTISSCVNEAKKWFSKKDFEHFSRKNYLFAKNNNLLDKFFWMNSGFNIDMTEKDAEEEAKKYENFDDFIKKSNKVYVFSKKYGLLKNYPWLKLSDKMKKKKEECYAFSKNFKSIEEFSKKGGNFYHISLRYGWTDEFFTRKIHSNFTFEDCLKEAKKYTTLYNFRKNSPGEYQHSLKHNYLKEFSWLNPLIDTIHKEKLWSIYGYFFEENKVFYVGLSKDLKNRRRSHETGISLGKYKSKSSVYKYISKNNIKITSRNFSILEENLTAGKAQELEDFYIKKFIKLGWISLNKAKAGSLGGTIKKWTRESNFLEARKYRSKEEFRNNNSSAYTSAQKHGWLKDYVWLFSKRKCPVVQYSLCGEYINEFPSISFAKKKIGGDVSRSCKDKIIAAKGFYWRYKSDVLDEKGEVLKKIEIDSGKKS